MALTGKQRRRLRALGHHLEPVVIVGQQGITPGIVAAVEQALLDHELVKVKFGEGPEDRKEGAAKLSRETNAELAQVLGRTALLYKERPEDPELDLNARHGAPAKRKPQRPVTNQRRPAPNRRPSARRQRGRARRPE